MKSFDGSVTNYILDFNLPTTGSRTAGRSLWLAALLGLGLWTAPTVFGGVGAISPLDSMTATGDAGMIMTINGISVNELLLGETTFPNPPEHSEFPASHADNFDLNLVGSADNQPYFRVMFSEPVMTVFVIENGGNDCGLMQALDASGQPVGATVYYCSHADLPITYLTGFGQPAAGLFVRMSAPVYGIQMSPLPGDIMGFDPVSISGSPRPTLRWERNPVTGEEQLVWFNSDLVLQQRASFNGIWSDVPGARSPHPVAPDGAHLFFRLRNTSPE